MSVITLTRRFLVANLLTLWYTGFALVLLGVNYVKNIFKNPVVRLKLKPPTCLSDPKYGVHKYIKVNNVKLHYVESGDPSKPLMIFLHGFPEFWYSWRYQIVEFKKDYWCIAVDMRGYGDSERPEGVSSYKLELLIEDIRDLVRQLGREKCILVAHDWGSVVASRFRDVYPKVLSGLIMLCGGSIESFFPCIYEDSVQRKMSWYVFFYRMLAIPEQLLQLDNMDFYDKIMSVPGKDTISSQDLECYKYWFGKQYAFTPPINYYRANFTYLPPEKRTTENVPMLMAYAANDKFLNKTALEVKLKQQYEHIEITTLDDCGHCAQQEEPQKVNNLIKEFLVKHNL